MPTRDTKSFDLVKLRKLEQRLDDVMELTDTSKIKAKLQEVEQQYIQNPDEMNTLRLGIIYHEVALNLSFFSKTEFKGYAKKSFDILTELLNSPNTTRELLPIIESYRASALSLMGAETRKLALASEAFHLFQNAVNKYASNSYFPEFLRGSVAENLPWFFFSKRKQAKNDFQSIIDKYEKDHDYANPKVMSFTFWARARQVKRNNKAEALEDLNKAIALDPHYEAGRARAEKLKAELLK